ncbi:MAG: phytanoyl-CoA dioxygenase family protein [Pseudomonadota bacterium]
MASTATRDAFRIEGYVIVRELIEPALAGALRLSAEQSGADTHAYEKRDADGRKSRVTLWYTPGDDVFGQLSSLDRVVNTMSDCLGGDAKFFHAKLMQKSAHEGGAWEWHQDYGYWYDDGFLTDAMGSCYIALDAATRVNGCLQVIPGSHRYGRLPHGAVGEQVGADSDRVAMLAERDGIVHCELGPGDAVFFHASLLHASAANTSPDSRWGLITSFHREDNPSISDDPRFGPKTTPARTYSELVSASQHFSTSRDFL